MINIDIKTKIKPLTIIYLHQYFNTPDMPGSTRSYEMARRLAAEGHTVHLITSWREKSISETDWRYEKISGINVHWSNVPYSNHMTFFQRIMAFFSFMVKATLKAISIKADVVFATSTPLTIAIPAICAAKKMGVPMVFEVRDLWPELPVAVGELKNPFLIQLARVLERCAYFFSKKIIVLSEGMKDGVVKAGISSDNVIVIPNSSDNKTFRLSFSEGKKFLTNHPYLNSGPLIVYAGTIGYIHNVEYIVDVASKMIKIAPEFRFLIIGDGKYRKKVIEKAKSLGVYKKNIWIFPPIPKQEIPVVLSAAKAVFSTTIDLPALWHNSANKFFDALAAMKPVIINYSGWQARLIKETKAGIVIPPHDPEKAARKIFEFVCDSQQLDEAASAAGKLADTLFDRDILFNRFHKTITDAVGKRL